MFKKQYFPESTIQALATNQTVLNRGKEIYEDANVKNLQLDHESRTILFDVEDKNFDYSTQLKFYPNGVASKYQCSCSAFKQNSGACKHVVASMLYLNSLSQEELNEADEPEGREQDTVNSSQTSNSSLSLKNPSARKQNKTLLKLKESVESAYYSDFSSVKKEFVNFEFVLNISGSHFAQTFEVYMKAGLNHLYVVKNIPHVILNLLEGNTYEFGKNFTFDPKHHAIRSEDKRVLEVLYNIYTLVRAVNQTAYEYSYANKRELEIPPQFLKEVSEAVSYADGGFVRFGRPPQHLSKIDSLEKITIEKKFKTIPIYMDLAREGTRYSFQVENYEFYENPLVFYTGSDIIQYEQVLYFVSSSEYHLIKSIFEALKEIQYQPILMKGFELTEFLSHIYPLLSSLFSIYVDEDIKKLTLMEDLTPEIYLDYKDNELIIKPVFKYGETTIYPLNHESTPVQTETILVRKLEKERELLSGIQHYISEYSVNEEAVTISSFENISYFIFEGMTELSESFDFYSTKAVQKLIYQPAQKPSVSMEMNESSNLLQISFQTEDITEEDLGSIIKQLNEDTASYYKLSNGQIVDLKKDEFQQLKQTVSRLDIDEKNIEEEIYLPLYKGLAVLDDESVQQGREFKKMAQALLKPKELKFEVPSELKADLRPYQEIGFKWLKSLDHYQFGGVLADDMGLGKTVQTIAFILSKLKEKKGKYLIICPSSVLYNWEFEFGKFAPAAETTLITGSMEERKEIIENRKNNETEVWITSYPLIQRDIEMYKDLQFETVILDESQNVKNAAAKTTQAVKAVHSVNKFALSGTPIENNLNELWSLFSIIQPGLFKDKNAFSQLQKREIAERIKPFILRRLKSEVLDDLPPKTETTEHIELSQEQKQLYQTQLSLIKKDVEGYLEEGAFESNKIKVLAGMTKLRQICCDPGLINQNYKGGSSKLERLFEYLEEARVNGKRVVLFSQFTKMLAIIRKKLDKQGIDYHYLDGQTKKENRLELTTRFNQGEKDLFLISLKAGGTGLNLTGGDTVILYDSWWNPAIEDQAADRVHRFGQKKSVQIMRLVTKGTIEERIGELQDKKRELIDSVIESGNSKSVAALSKDEILKLLEIE